MDKGKISKEYSKLKTNIYLVDMFVSFVVLVLFQFVLSNTIYNFSVGITQNYYVGCFFYSVILLLCLYCALLPLKFLNSYIVEKKYNLSNQTIKTWIVDEVKSEILSLSLSVPCFLALYFLIRNFHYWWIIGAGLWIILTIILARLMPILLLPIFFKYLSIEEGELKKRIADLACRCAVKLVDVSEINFSKKTKKANAALIGQGSTKRVILADTLTNNFNIDEIEVVLAHEFGHYVHKHTKKLIIFSSIVTFLGFYGLFLIIDKMANIMSISSINNYSLLPLILLVSGVFEFCVMPIQNLYSRILEKQADTFALDMTKKPSSFVAAMNKLAEMNLAEIDPPFLKKILFYSHPPIVERIKMAENYEEQ